VNPATSTQTPAADEVLRKLRERIVAFAASRIQRDAAEDLAQEVLLVLHNKYSDLTRPEDLLPVALQILRFKLVAWRRKALRRGEYHQEPVDDLQLADSAPGQLLDLERRELRERLIGAIGQLGERCRKLFALKLEGLGFQEIGERMGAGSINTVYAWDFRCRKQLLELVGGRWEGRR
jgi:RNA polymerase sigma-70 factor (ECF subfamily)